MKYLDEDAMFDLFDEQDFSATEEFVAKYGIEAVDRDGRNLLLNFIIEKDEDSIMQLIQRYQNQGLNINQVDNNGWTALHFAVQERKFSIIKKLVEMGAVINAQEKYGRTPVSIAIGDRLPEEIIKYLILNGADVNIPNNYGASPRNFLSKGLEEWLRDKN